jgi:putative PIG3 family NAD(P)H quinone oxidoreductase
MTAAAIPTTMMAVHCDGFGGPDVLRAHDTPVPVPGPGEVLVAVAAAGVNRPDVLQRQGNYTPPPGASAIPGLEIAGTVVARGAGATRFAIGDPVCALLAGGGYAAYVAVPEPQCLPLPKGLSMVEAAAVPETFFTVWFNVFDRGGLRAGESILIHGGASGIGTTAIALAHALGARVFATAAGAEKRRVCESLGAERCVDYTTEDFVSVVREATNGAGVDVILDIVGADYVARNLDLLAMDGRLIQIGMLGGPNATIALAPILRKRLTLTGSMMRSRSVEEKGRVADAVFEHVWPLLESGRVKPLIDRTFPLADAAGAHRCMEASSHIGKIVLEVEG